MANIDFGQVDKYFEDRGFGFISHTFTGTAHWGSAFFHIKTIARDRSSLVQELKSGGLPFFWYEFEKSERGAQVLSVVDPRSIAERFPENYEKISGIIERHSLSESLTIDSSGRLAPPPLPIIKSALELLPKSALSCLEQKRSALEQRKVLDREESRKIAEGKRREAEEKRSAQEHLEEEEFQRLVSEISILGFTHSSQVSNYIVQNRLGYKYENISGLLTMRTRESTWIFNGGFPPKIYARLCRELGLDNQGSEAKPGKFVSYKEVNKG